MKIIGLGYNYKISFPDGNYPKEPVIFLKTPNTLICNGENIIYPQNVDKVWVEAELAIIYGYGYAIANDITAENIDGRDHHLARSKSLQTFCPISEVQTLVNNPDNLHYRTWINDKLVQDANTKDMIYGCKEILKIVNTHIPLEVGDIILTGTHPGYTNLGEKGHIMTDGVIHKGDNVKIEFEHLGTLENNVI